MDGASDADAPTAQGISPGRSVAASARSPRAVRPRKRAVQPVSQRRGIVITLLLLAMLAPLVALSPWVLSGALILGCAIYVAFEFALVKLPLHRLERDVDNGIPGAGVLLKMKREMNAMLAASQFGITLTSLGLTLALEPA